MTLRSLENTLSLKDQKNIITASIVPVEVFILFITNMHQSFTITDLICLFETRHKIKLSFARMQQIANDLVLAGKIKSRKELNKKNIQTTFYSFNTIA